MAVKVTPPTHGLGYHKFDGGLADLDNWCPKWVHGWSTRCTAHTSSGRPCRAWSIAGGYVCVSHGGAAPQVRRAAQRRLAIAAHEAAYRRLVAWVLARQGYLDGAA